MICGSAQVEVNGISEDSRKIASGWLFIARKGLETNGHLYIDDAIERGAAAVILSDDNFVVHGNASVVKMEMTQENMAKIADNFYGKPNCKLIGITGTNGKTTTCFLTKFFLENAGVPTGIIGTVAYEFGDRSIPASRTTPDIFTLNELIKHMTESGAKVIMLEVSSHALDQNRIGNTKFDLAAFTNLSRDHLDYHKTMDGYFSAKRKLFDRINDNDSNRKKAVISLDDQWGRKMFAQIDEANIPFITYSSAPDTKAMIAAKNIVASTEGCSFELMLNGKKVADMNIPLIGHHNVSNCLAAMAIANQFGAEIDAMIDCAKKLPPVPGRLEFIKNNLGALVVVDYAHTDDALNKTLHCLKELNPNKLIVVFGCGGDRDRGKRAKMAAAAERYADFIVVTNDNPRTEDPDAIIDDIKQGLKSNKSVIEKDRKKAIEIAIKKMKKGDVVLIAGKGHETYQEINRTYHHFDDREVAMEIIGNSEDDR